MGYPVRGNGHNIAAAGAVDHEFVSMGHYVSRNSPGTPQFVIRGSEGVERGVFFFRILLYLRIFTTILQYFVVFLDPRVFLKTPKAIPKRFQNDPQTIPQLS